MCIDRRQLETEPLSDDPRPELDVAGAGDAPGLESEPAEPGFDVGGKGDGAGQIGEVTL